MKNSGEKIILLFCCLLVSTVAPGMDLSSLLKDPKIFGTGSNTFIKKHANRKFKWNNKDKTALMSLPARVARLTLFNIPTYETMIRFNKGQVSSIDISVYNRGDATLISQSLFYKRLAHVKKQLNTLYNTKGVSIPFKRIARRKIYSMKWNSPKQTAILEWSTSGRRKSEFKAEFIRLKVSAAGGVTGKLRSTIKSAKELTRRINRKPDGSVYLDLPMIDQGSKAYCAASSVERVLRYYGSDASQHLIAQLVDTSAYGGSNLHKLRKAMKKADVKLGVKVQTYDCGFDLNNYSQFKTFLRKYNKSAKKLKEHQVSEKEIRRNPKLLFGMMRSPAFIHMRRKDRSDFGKFKRAIHTNINNGIPVFWGLLYGIIKEQKQISNRVGGHMRLITGYNDKTNELIYSDTWGAGHEFKTMKIDKAWAVTIDIFTLKPRTKR
jgi:hypothetical protein